MNHIEFIAWMILYPLSGAVERYLYAKRCKLSGEKSLRELPGYTGFIGLAELAVYVLVASHLWT